MKVQSANSSRTSSRHLRRIFAALALAALGTPASAILADSDSDTVPDAEAIRDPLVFEDGNRSSLGGGVSTQFGPVAGALVLVYDASGNLCGRDRTDEAGHYNIAGLLPASYTIKVEAPGAIDAWYNGVVAAPGAVPTPYTLAGGIEGTLDFALDPGQGTALATIVRQNPDNEEAGDIEEVAMPGDAVAYLDMWPVDSASESTIDLGEISVPTVGAAPHLVSVKLSGTGAPVPSSVSVSGREGDCVTVGIATTGSADSLVIETKPAGATVYVDYADAPLGVTPLSVGNLLPGSHTILLEKRGYLRPRPVVAWVGFGEGPTEVMVPLHTAAETNEMTVTVSCGLADQEIYLDYRPTGKVAPVAVGGMDPASHAGNLWYSASHTILLRHPMARPWAPRYVPEPAFDAETERWSFDSSLSMEGPQLYDVITTVWFDVGGGIGIDPVELRPGDTVTLPAASRDGFTFLGWATVSGGPVVYASGATIMGNKETAVMALYARWARTHYKIKFGKNGGTGKMKTLSMAAGKAGKLRKVAFTRKGYVFAGWAESKKGPVVFNDKAKVNIVTEAEVVTLYARWAKPTYKVKFFANRGSGTMPVQTMTYGKATKLSANLFTRKGYKFRGWAKSKSDAKKGVVTFKNKKSVKNLLMNGKTVKLYAVWKHR